MGKLTRSFLFLTLLLTCFAGSPILAAEDKDSTSDITVTVPVTVLPEEGSPDNLKYTVELTMVPADEQEEPFTAPEPNNSSVTVTQDNQTAEFTIDLPSPGIYLYKVTPTLKSGKVILKEDEPRMVKVWRTSERKTGIKVYDPNDPANGKDLTWYVEDAGSEEDPVIKPSDSDKPVNNPTNKPSSDTGNKKQTPTTKTSSKTTSKTQTSVETQKQTWMTVALASLFLLFVLLILGRDRKEREES